MNKRVVNRDGKVEVLRNILNNNSDLEFVFLIDVNNIDFILLEGFNKFTDGRNILFIKNNIHNKVSIDKNFFVLDNKIVFAYLLPNADNKDIDKMINYIKNKYIVFGDLNIKTNKSLFKYISNCYGENTLQTVLINKNPVFYKNYLAPSDHNIVLYLVKLKIKFNINLKLQQLDDYVSKKEIKKLLRGDKFFFKPKVKIRKYNFIFNDREKVNEEILNDYIHNNVIKAYKKYNYLWRFDRKEPFLGTHVNDNIVKTFGEHLKMNKEKEYYNMIIDEECQKFYNEEIKYTKSKALNYDYLQLNTIYEAINEFISENIKNEDYENNENLIINVLKQINKCKYKLRANTFFLTKNKKLEDYNDVRLIVIMPTLVKIYETLIFNEVNDFMSEFIGKFKYQWGGLKGGSTYKALYDLRDKMANYNDDIRALFLLDMTKGYDSLDLDKLLSMVEKIQNRRIRSLLKNWVLMVKNLDLVMNNTTIKKTIGVPMGLTLSPLMFVFYVHNAIEDIKKDNMVLYIDDIALFIPSNTNNNEAENLLEDLINKLGKYNLVINKKKSVMISKDPFFIQKYKNDYDCKDVEKYLGRELKIGLDGKITQDNRFYFNGKKIFGKPNWLNFAIKRLIFNGALDARFRYKFYMWPTDNINVRKKIWENSWNLYKTGDSKYSYVQMSLVSTNIFRYNLDPLFIKKCYIKLSNNNYNTNEVNNLIKDKLYINKPQIDDIIKQLSCPWNLNLDINNKDIDWLKICKNFAEDLWIQFKRIMFNSYINRKENQGFHTFVLENLNFNSKLVKNLAFINDLIFNHINKNKNKQLLLWRFLDFIADSFYKWKGEGNNWNCKGVLNLDFINIKKDIFNINMNDKDWEKYAINNNYKYWVLIYDLFNLENKINKKISVNKDIDKQRDTIINKVFKFGPNKLSNWEYKLYDMSPAKLLSYKMDKTNKKKLEIINLKISFNKILKLFLIFDTIYTDKYYNNRNYDEVYINLLLKFDSLQQLVDKIVNLIDLEPVLEGTACEMD